MLEDALELLIDRARVPAGNLPAVRTSLVARSCGTPYLKKMDSSWQKGKKRWYFHFSDGSIRSTTDKEEAELWSELYFRKLV